MADDAYSLFRSQLEEWGLGQYADLIWDEKIRTDMSPAEALDWTRQQPFYEAAYPGIKQLKKDGSPYGSEGNYWSYVNNFKEQARLWGIPPGLYDTPQKIAESMVNGVSPEELKARFTKAAAAAYSLPQEVRDSLVNDFGASPGDLVGWYLNPDEAMPILDQKFAAAQVMGAATKQGVGLSVSQADQFARMGLDYGSASQGLGQVAGLRGLDSNTFGTAQGSDAQRVDAVLGADVAAAKELEKQQKSKQAQSAAGGGAAVGQAGVSGLGRSTV